jgi:hypothetical protein
LARVQDRQGICVERLDKPRKKTSHLLPPKLATQSSGFRDNERTKVTPVPSKVLDNSVGIEFDENVEDKQYYTCSPSQRPQQPALWRPVEAGDSKETVRDKVTHEDQVDDTPKDQPRVVLERCLLKLVVLWDLGLHLALDELIQCGVRVLARLRLLKDARVSCPEDKAIVLGLAVKQPSDASIVGGAPEQKYGCKDGLAGAFGQYVECKDQAGEDSENGYVGQVLWLRGREKLRDHVVSLGHDENCGRGSARHCYTLHFGI